MRCAPTCTPALTEHSWTLVEEGPVQQGALLIKGDIAYLLGRHTTVVDLADPSNPEILYEGESDWHGAPGDAAIKGNYLYMVGSFWLDGDPEGLVVYDISEPGIPRRVREVGQYRSWDVMLSGELLYVLMGNSIAVMDLSSPAAPIEIARVSLEMHVGTALSFGDHALLGSNANPPQGLGILDVSTPTDPVLVNRLDPIGQAAMPMASSGSIVYVAASDDLIIMDHSDPVHPRIIGALEFDDVDSNSGNSADQMSVLGDLLIVSVTGVNVLDVADPAHPFIAAYHRHEGATRIEGGLAVSDAGLIVAYYQGSGMSVLSLSCDCSEARARAPHPGRSLQSSQFRFGRSDGSCRELRAWTLACQSPQHRPWRWECGARLHRRRRA